MSQTGMPPDLRHTPDLTIALLIATGTPTGCAAQAPKSKLLLWALKALMSEQSKWALYLKVQGKNLRYLQPGDEMVASICTDDGLLDLGQQHHRIILANKDETLP